MRHFNIIALLVGTLFFLGCATSETTSMQDESATAVGDSESGALDGSNESGARAKTAYEGSTGSGLLMERYKSGNISGYRE